MRISVERYSDEITRVRMSSVSGRLVGYDVSVYLLSRPVGTFDE